MDLGTCDATGVAGGGGGSKYLKIIITNGFLVQEFIYRFAVVVCLFSIFYDVTCDSIILFN